jgi:hypothetical protein
MADWLTQNHYELQHIVNQVLAFFRKEENRVRLGLQMPGAPPVQGDEPPSTQYITILGTWYYGEFVSRAKALDAAYEAWEAVLTRSLDHRVRLKDTEKAMRQALRHLHRLMVVLPTISNNDLLAMGLPIVHKRTHTPAPVPDSHPEVGQIGMPAPGTVIIRYIDAKSKKTARPKGAHGCVFRYAVLERSPSSWKELTESLFQTHSPVRLKFDLDMRGKRVYFAMCWENMTGHQSDFGPIASFIIG